MTYAKKINEIRDLQTVQLGSLPLGVLDQAGNLLAEFNPNGQFIGIDTFNVGAASKGNVNNTYLLMYDNVPTNLSGYVLPFNCTLYAMTVASQEPEVWDAEIHRLGALVPGAVVSVPIASKSAVATMSVEFNAGDELQFFCNGLGIRRPNVQAFFRRR